MARINAETVAKAHAANFGFEPIGSVFAPGRVNLIGDHTDYNEGYVFPVALEIGTYISYSRNTSGRVRARSMNLESQLEREIGSPAFGDWLDYVIGALQALSAHTGTTLPAGLDLTIGSTVPTGASVSSSAALQVATLRAAVEAFGIALSPEDIAQLAQSAENNYVGVNCGLMDQMASSTGKPGWALFFDTLTLETTLEPLPTSHSFITLHSGLSRQLTTGAYNERRQQCEAASAQLGLRSLREATLDQLDALTGKTRARARHVVSENARVLQARDALKTGEFDRFGALMTESHWSLSQDFETSTREVDSLVASCLSRGVLGARITGAGFGGCIVALVRAGEEAALVSSLRLTHPTAWHVATSTGISPATAD
ncbi:MAG: galactokinase [Alphaproteobacteria bacterium TMED89]|nr:galactokinase [Rhodospirillaceae bacterium]RPH16911.1 MAG: galactokinase [Alphaproteobacteria bacterium TMED89]